MPSMELKLDTGLTRHFAHSLECNQNSVLMNPSKAKYREYTLWQRWFWEHLIRDEEDFMRHVDYIHFNPVKHGLNDGFQPGSTK